MDNDVGDIPIAEAVKIALRAKGSWKEPTSEDLEYEIQKCGNDPDVIYVRRGKNLKFGTWVRGQSCVRAGEVWRTDIISVFGELIQTRSQTRVARRRSSFNMLLDE